MQKPRAHEITPGRISLGMLMRDFSRRMNVIMAMQVVGVAVIHYLAILHAVNVTGCAGEKVVFMGYDDITDVEAVQDVDNAFICVLIKTGAGFIITTSS